MKISSFGIALAVAIASTATLTVFGQGKVAVIDTLEYNNMIYELGQTSLADLDINTKRHNYIDLVKHAQKAGWELCPADSASLKRIATKVHLDPDNRKFCAYVATVPTTDPESWRLEKGFWITEIASMSDGKPNGLDRELVGYFDLSYVDEVFPALDRIGTFGYMSLSQTPRLVMYDWVFIRPLDTTKN